ncbi:MAG: cupredoxin family protein [Burkholderiaceae bacterium]
MTFKFNSIARSFALAAVAATPMLALAAGEHAGGHGAHADAAAKPASGGHAGHEMGEMKHGDHHASAAGQAGDPAKVTRTVMVEMSDTMRFTPDKVDVKAGETVRFFVVNKGKMVHEMVIGMADEIDEHAEMMRKMPGMVHNEPNQITLAPGKRGGIVWQFTKAGTVVYACLAPGHKEAGMVGHVQVQ